MLSVVLLEYSAPQKKAYKHCQRVASGDPDYRGDCQEAGWVKNGWIAVAYEATLEDPPYNPSFGRCYGATRGDALSAAAYYRQQAAAESCVREWLQRTRYYNPAMPTSGG